MKPWEEFLKQLEGDLGKGTVAKWLRSFEVLRFDAANLYLKAEDSFQAAWFDEHIRPRAEKSLVNPNGRSIRVHIETTKEQTKKKEKVSLPSPFELIFDTLDSATHLHNFVPTEGTKLARELLSAICASGDVELGSFNPIYLYGSEGTGKSHLLMGCARALRSAGKRVLYCRTETFTDHVVRAIRAGEMQKFRQAYRNVDILLLDNIHVIARKAATQEELFHTFNALHVEGRQLIFAGNCAPQELESVEARLISRFEWGLALQLRPPTSEELHMILKQRATELDLILPPGASDFLLKTFSHSTRSAIKALETLVLRTHMNPQTLTLSRVQNSLNDLVEEASETVVTPQRIVDAVAHFYGIQIGDIMGKSQRKECSQPRKVAMFLCRDQLTLPFAEIGRFFCRDHSTVMTSVKQVEKHLDESQGEFTAEVHAIRKEI